MLSLGCISENKIMFTSYCNQEFTASYHLQVSISPFLYVSPPLPQLSRAILSLLSMLAVLFQREEAEAFLDVWLFVLRCSKLLRCCCIAVVGWPGGVVFGLIANRIVAICGSRHATAWSSAWVRHVGAGAVVGGGAVLA